VVTEVIAHDTERRWLLMADAGTRLADLGNPPERWLALMPAYAELQIGETVHADAHLAAGVPDLRTERLPDRYEDLLRASLPLEPDERRAFEAFVPRFAAMCADLGAAGIAASAQHDDLHMHNVYEKDGVLRVLDWGDASIAHPFCSLFETFRFLDTINGLPPDDPWFARLRDAYLEPWGTGHRESFNLAIRVGGIARAIAWLDQRGALPAADRPAFDERFGPLLRSTLARAQQP
jgi:hypothetical protein